MALSKAEQQELAQLEKDVGPQAQMRLSPGVQGLSPDEQREMQQLEGEVGHVAPLGKAQTTLEHGANALSLGYLPQMQAAAAPLIYKGLNALTGQNVEPDSYVNERDQNIKRLEAEQTENPKTALASQVGGGVLGAAIVPMGAAAEGAGIGKAALQGARFGAGYGFLQNPGDTEGEVNPLQLKDRVENAGQGLATGGITGGVTGAAAKVLRGAAGASENLKSLAETQAVKASGADLKSFRALEGKDKTNDIGRYLLDRGIVQAGDTVESVAQKAEAHNKQAGVLLDDIYGQTAKALKDPEVAAKMPGFNPVKDKDAILSDVAKQLGNATGKKQAVEKIGAYLDQLAEDHGDVVLSPRVANDVKSEIDKTINYLRNPLTKEPAGESAFKAARGVLAKKIEASVDFLGKASGDDDLASKLKSANREYGFSKQAAEMATDRVQRNNTNRMFSLTDTLAGAAGGTAGSVAGSAMGGDMRRSGEMGLIGAGLGAVTHHIGKQFGNAAMASGLDTAGDIARYSASPAAKGLMAVAPNQSAVTRGLLEAQMLKGSKKKRGLVAPSAGMLSGNE